MNASTDTFLNVIPNALKGVRVLTLALNLPGPAAVMRLKAMGAQCTKLEPLAPAGSPAGLPTDPMGQYKPAAYATLHKGVKVVQADLKSVKRGCTKFWHAPMCWSHRFGPRRCASLAWMARAC
jgi:CoA-transferase family III